MVIITMEKYGAYEGLKEVCCSENKKNQFI